MIPKNVRDGAVAQNLAGETKTFTIKPNGKAFRALIDGLYSNKVRSVIRELCSNAADSHIEAKQTKPFLVTIPTHLDPTFRVRDYGTSLSHDDVMTLYTTLFESSKETTNEQTGMLGLGSKSPFAYTDSFSVIAYKDGQKRVYLAFLERDGVPSITHVSTAPSTEPQGIEVSFPAKRDDIRQFQKEMQFVAMGYAIPPTVEGMDLKIPAPRLKGRNWAIYPRDAFGSDFSQNHFIRQGSAVYPTDQGFPNVGYGWVTIVEIPIGTAEVTTSREALSWDDETRRAVNNVRNTAYQELRAQVDSLVANAKTRIEKARIFTEYNGILTNLRGSTSIDLIRDDRQQVLDQMRRDPNQLATVSQYTTLPGEFLHKAEHFGKSANARGAYNRTITKVEWANLSNFHLLVNDSEVKVVRRLKRIRMHPFAWVLDVADPAERKVALAHLVKHLELRPDQITNVSDLPDCPPVSNGAPRKAPVKRVLKPGQYWMPRHDGRVMSLYGVSDRGPRNWPERMVEAARAAGMYGTLVWDDIFWVTEKQQAAFEKKGQLPESARLDKAIEDALFLKAGTLPIDQAITLTEVTRVVGSYNKAMPVVLDEFFPEVTIDQAKANEVLKIAQLAQLDLSKRPIAAKIDAKIKELISEYPLLFQRSDRKHYEHYVKAVKATKP